MAKLQNRVTRIIGELHYHPEKEYPFIVTGEDTPNRFYKKLAHLYAEWTDYEEPKEYWYINECGDVCKYKYDGGCPSPILEAKEIGNGFETEEEAEQAVKRLKALKRLKDKGFRFKEWKSYEEITGLSFPDRHIVNSYMAIFDFNKPCRKYEIENEVKEDLDLLFGDEK